MLSGLTLPHEMSRLPHRQQGAVGPLHGECPC